MTSRSKHMGYDAPLARREEDYLERWRLARQLLDTIDQTPVDWSVRIGLFGRYGEGKTTVLRYLEEQVNPKRHVICWFRPSRLRDLDHLWLDFAARLLDAANRAKIQDPILRLLKLRVWGRASLGRHRGLIKGLSKLNNIAKDLVGGGLALAEQILTPTGKTIRTIRSKLAGRRIIVLLDDLDRTPPHLLPNLLLALRDLLDQPEFTFVLAFDKNVVAETLHRQNSAWGSGLEFLAKIIDFEFFLAEPNREQKARLFRGEMAKHAPFVPESAVEKVEDLVPSNPRDLKMLVRHLAVLRQEVARHGTDELDWMSVIFAELIRLKSEPLLMRFLDLLTSRPEGHWNVYALRGENREKEEAAREQELAEAFNELGIEDRVDQRYLRTLCHAWLMRAGLYEGNELRYYATFAFRPHAVTQKEFEECFVRWCQERTTDTINLWIQQHADARGTTTSTVAGEIFDAAADMRSIELGRAADAFSVQEHGAHLDRAVDGLHLLAQLFIEGVPSLGEDFFRSPARFLRIVRTATRYASFRANVADAKARDDEQRVLRECAEAIECKSNEYLEALAPWEYDAHSREELSLLESLTLVLELKVAHDVFQLVRREGGFATLHDETRSEGIRFVLLRAASPLWQARLRPRLLEALKEASSKRVLQDNAADLFELLVRGCRRGYASLRKEEVARLVRDREVLASTWAAITANQVQFRMLYDLRKNRKALIAHGAAEDAMPCPEWLLAGAEDDDKR